MYTVSKQCFACGKVSEVKIVKDKVKDYKEGLLNIQNIFPEEHVMVREFLISGMCFDCQSKMFNIPKPDEDWGKMLGNCPNCGCQIWRKNKIDNDYRCPSCYQIWEEDELE